MEISIKNLAHIIEARMEEIIEMVHTEIITSGYDQKLAGGVVITGGGAQLTNLKQLFEYMTGTDTRVGHPNEHLGKSKVELVKSPMYATTIGLVLSGFRALDARENRYNESKSVVGYHRAKTFVGGGDFFKKILDKTKGLLIDDLDGKKDY
jgi:cell division protein FtsA